MYNVLTQGEVTPLTRLMLQLLITEFRNRGHAEQDHRGRGRHGEVGEAGGRGQRQGPNSIKPFWLEF